MAASPVLPTATTSANICATLSATDQESAVRLVLPKAATATYGAVLRPGACDRAHRRQAARWTFELCANGALDRNDVAIADREVLGRQIKAARI